MTTYRINLPEGDYIKYRISKETKDWTLLEVVVPNKKIVEYLNYFSDQSGKNNNPVGEIINEPKEEENESAGFTDEQIKKMKEIKEKMNMKSNDELNDHIFEASYGQNKTWKDLNKDNIDDFINFMNEEYLTE